MHEDRVHQILGDIVAEAAERDQTAKREAHMQCHEFESSVGPVGRLERQIERGPARGGHDLAAKLLNEGEAGAPGAPSGENHYTRLDATPRKNCGAALHWFDRMG